MSALCDGILAGDLRAVARACRRIDECVSGHRELLSELFAHRGKSRILGITGSPGTGKSTLTDALISLLRQRGERVGVVAVDPSSPFTGGALLGDRIHMQRHATDPEVFIRSVATRGAHGGLSRSAEHIVGVLEAWGAHSVLVETVGVGQAELDVLGMAHSLAVVVVPGMGDDVQANKAGILEAADVLVLNKADRDGVDATEHDLAFAVALGGLAILGPVSGTLAGAEPAPAHTTWTTPIVRTVATSKRGIDELLARLDAHGEWLRSSESGRTQRAARERRQALSLLRELIADALLSQEPALVEQLLSELCARRTDPWSASKLLLRAAERLRP